MASIFTVYYSFTKNAGSGRHEATFMVKAESELVAFHIAEQQAKARHPDCVVFVKEVRRR